MSLKGALTDSRALLSAPLCSDERRDWIAAPCDDCRVQQSNRGTHPGKAAAMGGSLSSHAALNVPSVTLMPSIGHRGCSRHPRAPFPPTAVTAGHRFTDVSTSECKAHFWRRARWQRCASRHRVLQIGDGGCSEHPPTQF